MIVEKLKSILNLMPDIFYDETLLKNALGRVFSDDKRSQNILFIVIESGVIDNALLVKTVNKPAYEAYVNTLYNDYGIEKIIAKDYIGYWFEALNIPYENFKINLPPKAPIKIKSEDSAVDERRDAEKAIRSLSRSEMEATIHLIDRLENMEGIVVASRIADRYGITRSVIVNAMKKLEMAKMLESRSLGMKGMYIKITNTMLPEVIEECKERLNAIRSYI